MGIISVQSAMEQISQSAVNAAFREIEEAKAKGLNTDQTQKAFELLSRSAFEFYDLKLLPLALRCARVC